MNRKEIRPLTPSDRDRALARLGRLTVGAGIGSLVALGGLGFGAAASYSGKHATASTAPTATSAATTAPTLAPTPTPAPVAATAAPVVTTGGS